MLGIPYAGIYIPYLLCLASAVLCVVYGIVNWNKGGEEDEGETIALEAKEQEIKENL